MQSKLTLMLVRGVRGHSRNDQGTPTPDPHVELDFTAPYFGKAPDPIAFAPCRVVVPLCITGRSRIRSVHRAPPTLRRRGTSKVAETTSSRKGRPCVDAVGIAPGAPLWPASEPQKRALRDLHGGPVSSVLGTSWEHAVRQPLRLPLSGGPSPRKGSLRRLSPLPGHDPQRRLGLRLLVLGQHRGVGVRSQ
jgi:hypothetical protein